ncbi:MAG: serine/threonine protein kinase [Verrucomicrobiales bacterium]|nr:serine/threonine protein kinase [Verrucomicrobiales bacterium]
MNQTQHTGNPPGGAPIWEPPSAEGLSAAIPAYEVESLLGRGGMGAVYRAVQRSLKRTVAIKVLPPTADDELKFAERFRHEAETLARLNHPGIVHIHDFGETADGLLYLVMEYVDGTDAHRLIQANGRLSEDYALAVTAHVCDALAYAHSRGVVHRDIKPANVLIDQEGKVKVADFGLAKMVDPIFDSGLTMSNVALGTPDFVAPEVLSMGMTVDHRADLYAVGVMLYQMLTGEVPRGLFKLPSQRYQEIDPRLDGVICRALEPDREERYQSALEVRAELVEISTTRLARMSEATLAASPPMEPTRKRGKAGVLIACLAALAAVGVWVGMVVSQPEPIPTVAPPAEIGLLETVDLERDVIAGTWFSDPGGLKTLGNGIIPGARGGYPRVEFAQVPPPEYDFEVEFTAESEELDAGIAFSIGGKQTALIMNVHGGTGYVAGLAGVGGVPMHVRLGHNGRPTPYYRKGQRAVVLVQVRKDRVTTKINGEIVEEWPVTSSFLNGLALGSDFTLDDPAKVGIMAGPLLPITFHRAVLREVTESGSPGEASLDSPTSTEPKQIGQSSPISGMDGTSWTDITAKVREEAAANPALVVEPDGIRRAGDGSPVGISVTDPSWRNYAIRIRHSADSQINLRGGDHGMIYVLNQKLKTLIHRHDTGATEAAILEAGGPHPSGFDVNRMHELVATVEDNLFRAWVDGRPAGQVRDNTFANGSGSVMWVRQSVVHSVEVAPLSESLHQTMRESFWGQVKEANAERQVEIVEAALESINGNDVSLKATIEGGKVTALTITQISGSPLHDLSPVAALTDLKIFFCYAPGVRDLEWLRGLPIEHLQLEHAEVENLDILRESKVTYLTLGTPDKPPRTYEALAGIPLRSLSLQGCPLEDLSFLSDMPLNRLVLAGTGITDHTPLKAFPLAEVDVDLVPERDLPILLSIPTLKKINGKPVEEYRGNSPVAVGQDIWTDWLGEKLADPNMFQGDGWIREDGGITTDQSLKGIAVLPEGTRDGAVRIRFAMRDSEGVQITTRERRDALGRHLYLAHYTGENYLIAYVPADAEHSFRLFDRPLPAPLRARSEHTLEFRFIGDQFDLVLDGELHASARHSVLKEGRCAVVLTKGVLVKSIETLELPQGAGPPPALSPPNRGGGAPAP